MRKHLLPLAALLAATPALPQASANIAAGRAQPSPLAPAEIVNAAPKADWAAIASSDLLVMDLAPDAKGKPRRVVIQLMPAPFSQGWVGNIRKLAAARFWDGTSINRVQDNYVVQWGDANAEDKAKAKALPGDLTVMTEADYRVPLSTEDISRLNEAVRVGALDAADFAQASAKGDKTPIRTVNPLITIYDAYLMGTAFSKGWPLGFDEDSMKSPVHCYGMVGVGRDMPPNTGTGAELYTVIGHAPRHLDRNIALVGRVIEGIEHLSSLPRGTGALGFYETPEERTPIMSVRIGSEVSGLPAYEYLSTESESFARYADARANRRDAFFIRPAGGADVCNIPVPVRRVK
ncbi:MAG: peptidylprolyl isomerase [Pseudomonadota bacterium]